MALGRRIKEAREARNLEQQELCDLVNARLSPADKPLTQPALSALEVRDSRTAESAPYIADALKINLRWLLTGQGARDEAEWPFTRVSKHRWDACGPEDRGYVQAAINRALDECEASRSKHQGLAA